MRYATLGLTAFISCLPQLLCAQASAPDIAEAGSVEEIARATTEARFLSPWVAYLPASASVVSPRTFLHRIPGAPGAPVHSATAYAYCQRFIEALSQVKAQSVPRAAA